MRVSARSGFPKPYKKIFVLTITSHKRLLEVLGNHREGELPPTYSITEEPKSRPCWRLRNSLRRDVQRMRSEMMSTLKVFLHSMTLPFSITLLN
jgi:hypothetical protein